MQLGEHLCDISHRFNCQGASRGPSVIGELLVVLGSSGVATGWTGVDVSTPLLLEVAREIDTNLTSFCRGRGRGVAPPPDPRYRLALSARHVCPPHIF